MSAPPPPLPPAQELRDLIAQAVATEYLLYRKGASEKETESKHKPVWLQLFESTGFAALITVVLGGIVGGIITSELQTYGKARDAQIARTQLEHDRNLTEFREHLDRERKVVDEMFLKLGQFIDASRDLTTLSRKEFCERCGSSHAPPSVILEKQEVVKRYNNTTVEWNTNRLRLGMLLQLEHNNDEKLFQQWKEVCNTAEAYAECADRWRTKYDNLEFHEALKACAEPRKTFDDALQAFTQRIVVLRSSPQPASSHSPE